MNSDQWLMRGGDEEERDEESERLGGGDGEIGAPAITRVGGRM